MPIIFNPPASAVDRLELIMRGINDGIWDWNLLTNAVYFSPRWKELIGFADDEFENKLEAWQRRIHPDDFNRVLSSLEQHLEGLASPSGLEYRLRHKDNSYRWILSRAVAVFDDHGVPYRMVGSHTDITERKRIELSLRESENNLRSLLENAENFVVYRVAVDPENPYGGRVILVSPSIRSITGIEDPYRYESWFEDLHPDDLPRAIKANQIALTSGLPYKQETRVFHRDRRTWVWLQTLSNPVFDAEGRLTHYNGLIHDITAQKQAREALAYQAAFENLVTTISTEFINLAPEQIDAGIERALKAIGEFSGVDRSYLFRCSEDQSRMDCVYEWCAESIEPQMPRLRNVPVAEYPWSNARILAQQALHVPSLAGLPPEAQAEKDAFDRRQIRSLVAVPMAYQGKTVGFLGFDAVRSEKSWPAASLALLKIVGEIFVNALEHKRAQAIQAGQRQFLELLASGKSLPETLHALVTVIEEQSPGMLGLILLLDPDEIHLRLGAFARLPEEYARSIEGLKIGPRVGSCGTACYTKEMVVVEDILSDPRWDGLRDLAAGYGLRACWSQPVLDAEGKVLGTFAMYYHHTRTPSADELRTIQTAGHLVGIAIEHERAQARIQQAYQVLERRVEERTRDLERRRRVAEGLRDILAFLNSNRPLQETLDFIAGQARHLLGAYTCIIHRLDPEQKFVYIESTSGLPGDLAGIRGFPLNLKSHADAAILNRQPVFIGEISPRAASDAETNPDLLPDIRLWRRTFFSLTRAYLATPLIVAGEVYGSFAFYFEQPQAFDVEQVRLAGTLADHAALAIENARLREQVQHSAVTAERSRLARDLHDAVTQTLFSASLIADVLPRLWERNPEEGRRQLEEIRQLTRGALAEMRTLLLELRPNALVEGSLTDLLKPLCEAFISRTRVPVHYTVEGKAVLPPDVQIGLYRIAQELLNNAAKHAQASEAWVDLRCTPNRVDLEVRDDGCGFDASQVRPGHFGLGIVRERAAAIGAALEIDTRPNQGTCVRVRWAQPASTNPSQEMNYEPA